MTQPTRDYIGILIKEADDAEQSGVKGMKWGVRKDQPSVNLDSATGKASVTGGSRRARKRLAADVEANPEKHGLKRAPETSSERYDRLLNKAKTEGPNSFTDEELQFVTKRGNAIQQVNRLNERKPGWISEVAKQVLKQQTQKRLSSASDTLGKKYIDDPLSSKSQ